MYEKRTKSRLHLLENDRTYSFRSTYGNPDWRIDSLIRDANARNFKFNSKILPLTIEAIIICAQRRIAFQGHQQDKINFGSDPTCNFISILQLLAEANSDLNEHLVSGPKNAKYTSKTIQHEILGIAAN